MKTRFIHEIGTRASLRVYWGGGGDTDPRGDVCPNCLGGGHPGYHNAEVPLTRTGRVGDWDLGGKPDDYSDERWPTKCDGCGKPVPADVPVNAPEHVDDPSAERGFRYVSTVHRQVHRDRLYDTPSGKPEPGSIYEAHWLPRNFMFDDVERHLVCVLPNGHHWQMTGRASNCSMPEDRKHRCWVIHEEPPGVFHVDKDGLTCAAGAGSIAAQGWHGFLRHGELTQC